MHAFAVAQAIMHECTHGYIRLLGR